MRWTDELFRCFESILVGAEQGVALGNQDLIHLASSFGAHNYLRIAKTISQDMPAGKILDWGCGYGQMTLLLRSLGLDVEPFDVEHRPIIEKIAPFSQVKITYGAPDAPLPYSAGSFDALLSCGTLEHVGSQEESLVEIHRVLKPQGKLFVFMLPNKWSYTEKAADMLGKGSHPVKFTARSAARMLENAGFEVKQIARANALPHNLTGFPHPMRAAYGRLAPALTPIDRLLSAVPPVNRFCGVLEIMATKK